ncbi:unnamed protein product [Cochlearia groenlandica]
MAQFEIMGLDSVLQAESEIDPKSTSSDTNVVSTEATIDPKKLEKDRRVRYLLTMSLTNIVLKKVIKAK